MLEYYAIYEGIEKLIEIPFGDASEDDDQSFAAANQLYEKVKRLIRDTQLIDVGTAKIIVESANDAIRLFGNSEQEKKVELKEIIEDMERVLPPSTFKALMERAEEHLLKKTYPRKRIAQTILLISLALISLAFIVWAIYRNIWPKENNSPSAQNIAPISPEPSHASPSPAPTQREAIREGSARELVNYLSTLQPLQRKPVIESSYLGRRINWSGRVLDLRERDKDYFISVEDITDGPLIITSLFLPKDWRSKVENLRKDDLVKYSGVITRIDVPDIFVEVDEITVEQRADKLNSHPT